MSTSIEQLLKRQNFRIHYQVSDLPSIAKMVDGKHDLCGIYILHFSNGEYYVGQTVNIIHRYASHRQTYPDIERISFKPTEKRNLDEAEKNLIRLMENAGFFLRNIALVSYSTSETDFDKVMHKAIQERWLEDVEYIDAIGERYVNDDLRRRYTKNWSTPGKIE